MNRDQILLLMEMVDPYQILGINKNATSKEIKKAYKIKISKEHPDHGGDETSFKTIQTAYKIIGNEKLRKRFDKLYSADYDELKNDFSTFLKDEKYKNKNIFEELQSNSNNCNNNCNNNDSSDNNDNHFNDFNDFNDFNNRFNKKFLENKSTAQQAKSLGFVYDIINNNNIINQKIKNDESNKLLENLTKNKQ